MTHTLVDHLNTECCYKSFCLQPPIIQIVHVIASEDLSHGNAVQHVNSRIVRRWLQYAFASGPKSTHHIPCTDGGAPSLLCKMADQIVRISKQGVPDSGTPHVQHIFRGLVPGNDDSGAEIGNHKRAADRYQVRAVFLPASQASRAITNHDNPFFFLLPFLLSIRSRKHGLSQ